MAIYSGFAHLNSVIFHSYVRLPEGKKSEDMTKPYKTNNFMGVQIQNSWLWAWSWMITA